MAFDAYIAVQANTAPVNTFKTWNFIEDFTLGTSIANLLDDTGNLTGITFALQDAPDGEAVNGVNSVGSGAAVWVDEAVISDQMHFIFNGNVGIYRFSGLDNTKTYNIELFASVTLSGRVVEISVDGFSTVADSVNASNNSTDTAVALSIVPASGIIDLSVRGDASLGHCNALRLTEVDGPVSIESSVSWSWTGQNVKVNEILSVAPSTTWAWTAQDFNELISSRIDKDNFNWASQNLIVNAAIKESLVNAIFQWQGHDIFIDNEIFENITSSTSWSWTEQALIEIQDINFNQTTTQFNLFGRLIGVTGEDEGLIGNIALSIHETIRVKQRFNLTDIDRDFLENVN